MKILFTVATYYPLKDGVQAITQYQAEYLAANGHKVTVITQKNNLDIDEESINGVKIIRVNAFTKHGIHCGNKKIFMKILKEYSKEIDVLVNVCTQSCLTDWTYKVLDTLSCKKILYMHGIYDYKWNRNNLKNINSILSKIYNCIRWGIYYKTNLESIKKYDRVIHLHEKDYSYKYMNKGKFYKNEVLYNFAEDIFFENIEVIENKKQYILCVANYQPIKNQEMIIEAYYKSNIKDMELIFIGAQETEYLKKLRMISEKYNNIQSKKVVFKTNIERRLIPIYMFNSSVTVLTSLVEKFPVSIIESIALATPFISTNVGCCRYIPGGIVVKNLEELIYWFNMLQKCPEVIEDIGISGKKYADKYLTGNIACKKLEDILYKVLI